MTPVDWKALIPEVSEVEYSSLTHDHAPFVLNADLALLRLRNGLLIDVSWKRADGAFVACLIDDSGDRWRVVDRVTAQDVGALVDCVAGLAKVIREGGAK